MQRAADAVGVPTSMAAVFLPAGSNWVESVEELRT